MQFARFAGRGVLAVVFLMAAVAKILDPQTFADRVLLHSGLSPTVGNAVVSVLPWLELTCGLCLAVGYAVREAAAVIFVLLLGFVSYIVLVPAEQDCGCLVIPTAHPIDRVWHLLGDVALLLCCLPILCPLTLSPVRRVFRRDKPVTRAE